MTAIHYEGRPCKRCGARRRYRCNGACVSCLSKSPAARIRKLRDYAADPDKHRAAARAAYWKDPAACRARARAYRKANPERYKELSLRRKYALGIADVEAMHRDQGGVCAMCARPLVLWSRETHIDHDHGTGKVRGLLCDTCNPALGHYEKIRHLAVKYLERFK